MLCATGPSLFTLDALVSAWKTTTDFHADGTLDDDDITSVAGPVKPVWWNRRWVPLFDDGAGNSLCVDLDPDEGGGAGQIVQYWHDDTSRTVEAPDFKSVLASVMNELESGKTSYGEAFAYFEHDDGKPYLAVPESDIDVDELLG